MYHILPVAWSSYMVNIGTGGTCAMFRFGLQSGEV